MNNIRQIELYIQLPSQLKHWNPESIHVTSNNLGITGSCVQDDFTSRIADGLFNGAATVGLIESCCSSISNAWDCPITDLAAILIGIQLANGNESDVSIVCPECQYNQLFSINLTKILTDFDVSIWNQPIVINKLTFNFAPPNYRKFTDFSIATFKYQKTVFQLKNLATENIPENMLDSVSTSTIDLQLQILEDSIHSIELQGGFLVQDKIYIRDFLKNSEIQVIQQLLEHLNKCLECISPKNIQITCQSCKHQYEAPLNMDMSVTFRNKLIQAPEEDIVRMLNKMAKENKSLKADIIKMIWYMRGAISLSEAMQLTNHDRETITKLIESNLQITKESGLPFF